MEFNFALRECNVKIVYYGPGLSGKTTNLEIIHAKTPENNRGKLTALATDLDRTLFFDYMPLELGKISGLTVRLRLFTVPGQVYYNATRKLVLRCVDGIVFVADSQESQRNANIESLENLYENMAEHGLSIKDIPVVLQFNKRDLANIMPLEKMAELLNGRLNAPYFPATAIQGDGVFQCLKGIANLTMVKVEETLKDPNRRANLAPQNTRDAQRSALVGPSSGSITLGPKANIPPQNAPVNRPKNLENTAKQTQSIGNRSQSTLGPKAGIPQIINRPPIKSPMGNTLCSTMPNHTYHISAPITPHSSAGSLPHHVVQNNVSSSISSESAPVGGSTSVRLGVISNSMKGSVKPGTEPPKTTIESNVGVSNNVSAQDSQGLNFSMGVSKQERSSLPNTGARSNLFRGSLSNNAPNGSVGKWTLSPIHHHPNSEASDKLSQK